MKRSSRTMFGYCSPTRILLLMTVLTAADILLYLFTRLNIIYIIGIAIGIIMYLIGFIVISSKLIIKIGKMRSDGELESALDDFSS